MEVSAKKASLPHIPIEIIRHILLKSRVKSLIRCQCVCKEWRSLIQHPDFKLSYRGQRRAVVISQEPRRRSFTVRSITENLRLEKQFQFREHLSFLNTRDPGECSGVWCSCDGLVLFSVGEHIFLLNPSTQCSTKVLELRCLKNLDYGVVSGLCYDSSNRDYKAVLLLRHQSASFGYGGRFVIVASLKNKEWREVRFPYNLVSARDGIEFHRTLHWRVSDIKRDRRDSHYDYYYGSDDDSRDWEWDYFSECNKIIYFDPKCDEFRELPTPEPKYGGENSIVGLGIIDDCLCIARKVEERETIEVLVMKEYKVKESWVRKFVIPMSKLGRGHPYHDIVLYSPKNNSKILIWDTAFGVRGIFVYDLKKNKLNNFLEESVYGRHVVMCSYVESFTSPDGFIWRDDQHKRYANYCEIYERQFIHLLRWLWPPPNRNQN